MGTLFFMVNTATILKEIEIAKDMLYQEGKPEPILNYTVTSKTS